MAHPDSSFHVFDTHAAAEDAIRALGQAGVDMTRLSLVGKGYHSEEHPVGFYSTGDKIRAWGSTGAFWGSMWGILMAPAVFMLPPLGMIAMAGPIVSVVISALEGAVLVGGLSAVGAALSQLGVPKDQVIVYETALKADKYVLMVHGSDDEVARAKSILAGTQPMEVAETLLN